MKLLLNTNLGFNLVFFSVNLFQDIFFSKGKLLTIVQPNRGYSNNSNNSPNGGVDDKGYIKVDGKSIMITRSELDLLIEKHKQEAIQQYSNDRLDPEFQIIFQQLVNGFFSS
jgi:hypothetical protein